MTALPDTRERILDAARRLFHSHGYNGVGINDICLEADVVKGSFYHFFAGKQALLEAVLEHNADRLFAGLGNIDESTLSGREKLIAQLRGTAATARAQKRSGAVLGCDIGTLATELAVQNAGARRVARTAFRRWLQSLERLVREGIEDGSVAADADPAATAAALLALIQGLSTLGRSLNDARTLETIIDLAAQRLVPPQ